jgi:hypothetical protein
VAAEAQRLDLPFLGELPLALEVRIAGDAGTPPGPLARGHGGDDDDAQAGPCRDSGGDPGDDLTLISPDPATPPESLSWEIMGEPRLLRAIFATSWTAGYRVAPDVRLMFRMRLPVGEKNGKSWESNLGQGGPLNLAEHETVISNCC